METTPVDTKIRLFKALADPHRLQILGILQETVRCNCHLQDLLDLAPNLLSYHLKVLREAGLIVGKRRGRWIDYSIDPEAELLMQAAIPVLEIVDVPDPDGDC
ncbi:putative transcriptional regulator, ArsR family [hydrothermal vent metagenome]|uniref:Putative transcriptional regulator, ArsR family n=1 Tax=hydrothermal vent metagenome TaxID=652676 RepID=A0A3B0T7Q6_9ZZZZ